MASDQKSDMCMMFVLKGNPVSAECALDKFPDDDLMTEFEPATYEDYSNFFEVSSFDFGISVEDDEAAKGAQTAHSPLSTQATKNTGPSKGSFASWRSATQDQLKDLDYPVKVDDFNFTRLIDAASPVFFQKCCEAASFDKVILVKRISTGATGGGSSLLDLQVNIGPLQLSIGGASGGSRPPQAYLRIEFTEVLITKINWTDGDAMQESCTFICKNFKIKYKQQKDDGTLSGVVSPAEWDQTKNARRKANP